MAQTKSTMSQWPSHLQYEIFRAHHWLNLLDRPKYFECISSESSHPIRRREQEDLRVQWRSGTIQPPLDLKVDARLSTNWTKGVGEDWSSVKTYQLYFCFVYFCCCWVVIQYRCRDLCFFGWVYRRVGINLTWLLGKESSKPAPPMHRGPSEHNKMLKSRSITFSQSQPLVSFMN